VPIYEVRLERSAEAELLIEAESPEDAEKVALDQADEVFDLGGDGHDEARAHRKPIDPLDDEDVRHHADDETVWVGEFVERYGARVPGKGEWVKLNVVVERARAAAESPEALAQPTPGQLDFEGGEVPAR
jgi:hypothetical protein